MGRPFDGVAVSVIRGPFGVMDDTGSAGLAAVSAGSYGYQSVNLSNYDSAGWVNSKWVIEVWREGVMIHTVCSDSGNATGYQRVQLPDGSRQYGNGLWWFKLMEPTTFVIGDVWRVYGWQDGDVPLPYPVDRT